VKGADVGDGRQGMQALGLRSGLGLRWGTVLILMTTYYTHHVHHDNGK
jgi:hypothetical protein